MSGKTTDPHAQPRRTSNVHCSCCAIADTARIKPPWLAAAAPSVQHTLVTGARAVSKGPSLATGSRARHEHFAHESAVGNLGQHSRALLLNAPAQYTQQTLSSHVRKQHAFFHTFPSLPFHRVSFLLLPIIARTWSVMDVQGLTTAGRVSMLQLRGSAGCPVPRLRHVAALVVTPSQALQAAQGDTSHVVPCCGAGALATCTAPLQAGIVSSLSMPAVHQGGVPTRLACVFIIEMPLIFDHNISNMTGGYTPPMFPGL